MACYQIFPLRLPWNSSKIFFRPPNSLISISVLPHKNEENKRTMKKFLSLIQYLSPLFCSICSLLPRISVVSSVGGSSLDALYRSRYLLCSLFYIHCSSVGLILFYFVLHKYFISMTLLYYWFHFNWLKIRLICYHCLMWSMNTL